MGSFAGAPYLSANLDTDLQIQKKTLELAAQGLIDPVENMEQDNVYIYQGLLDTITPWGIQKIALLVHHSAGVDTFSFIHFIYLFLKNICRRWAKNKVFL